MLVLSREPGTSIMISSATESWLVTVLKKLHEQRATTVLISRASAAHPGQLESQTEEVALDATITLGKDVEVTLVDVREDKVRLGINAPKEHSVHRLEVWLAIRNENRKQGQDPEGGLAGSAVPRPPSPKPPSLDVRLQEPPPADDAGE